MARVTEDPDKEVLCADVGVDHARSEETEETDTICDLLEDRTCGAERGGGDVASTPLVHDEREREVGGGDDAHAPVQGLAVLLGLPHLGDDGDEGGCAGGRDEDGDASSDTGGKGGQLGGDGIEADVGDAGRRSEGTRVGSHADDDDEDGDEDRCEALFRQSVL